MPKFKLANLKVGSRLILGFGSLAVLLLVLVGVGWSATATAGSNARQSTDNVHWSEVRVQVVVDFRTVAEYANTLAADYEAHLPAAADLATYQSANRQFLADYATLTSDSLSSQESALAHQAKSAYDTYVSVIGKAEAAFKSGTAAGIARGAQLVSQPSEDAVVGPFTQLSKIQQSEVKANDASAVSSASTSRNLMLVVGAIAVVLAVGFAFGIIRSITKPLTEAGRVLDLSAEGDLRPRAKVSSEDELGQMAKSLNRQLDARQQLIRSIADVAHGLASASEELTAISTQLASGSEETSAQATTVSAAAEQVSSNVQTVAAASEELSASIKEIARSAADASGVARQGVNVAQSTSATVSQLNESSARIGEVVKLITSIAQQTNLLALNATIEAARAGEAGRGFAIVANEVKELAKETAKATEEIAQTVEAIQGDSQATIDAIGQIDRIMEKVNQAQATIASAVEQQTATTAEIGRTVQEAATGSGEIARSISHVATAAQDTTAGASSTQQAAGELARMAGDLQQLVSSYKF